MCACDILGQSMLVAVSASGSMVCLGGQARHGMFVVILVGLTHLSVDLGCRFM